MAEGRKSNNRSLPILERITLKINKKRINKYGANDIIFRETITPQVGAAPNTIVRGGIDMWFMLIVLVLLSFGAVMSYSASAVYAERYYDSSTYFLWRYIFKFIFIFTNI